MQEDYLSHAEELFSKAETRARIMSTLNDIKSLVYESTNVHKWIEENPPIFIEQEILCNLLLTSIDKLEVLEIIGKNMINVLPREKTVEKYCGYLYLMTILGMLESMSGKDIVTTVFSAIPINSRPMAFKIFEGVL